MFLVPVNRETRHLSRLFDDTFDRFFGLPGTGPAAAAEAGAARSPALDVSESERGYTVKLDMPGVAKEDIHVTVEGNVVTLRAEVKQEDRQTEGEKVLRNERYYGALTRSFQMPVDIDDAASKAKFDNGVLQLTLPKKVTVAGQRLSME